MASLDAQKAFDTVDHEVLFNKLYHLGIKGHLWLLLRNLYRNANVRVKWNGNLSDEFTMLQGTKQGAKLSTTLYKCYNNSTLDCLVRSNLGAYIGNIPVAAPTCADDIALLANSQENLQSMLNIIEFCSKKDKVTINPEKSEILPIKVKHLNPMFLNGKEINQTDNLKHLGIVRTSKNTLNTEDRLKIARQTIYALLGPGLHARRGLSPKVAVKLWKTYVLPRSLYGIEVLQNRKTDIERLEKQQRQMLKHFQGLPERTATVGVHILLGAEPIESIIDKQKLSLFMNICRLSGSTECKVLSRQLVMSKPTDRSFASNIKDILQKYSLPSARSLINNPVNKPRWKQMVEKAVSNYWYLEWVTQLQEKSTLKYLQIQDSPIQKAHNLWNAVQPYEHDVKQAEVKARLITGTYILQTNTAKFNQAEISGRCHLCQKADENLQHFLLDCPELQTSRTKGKQLLKATLEKIHPEGYNKVKEPIKMLQVILDCTHKDVAKWIYLKEKDLHDIERATQAYCFHLHNQRVLKLTTSSNS